MEEQERNELADLDAILDAEYLSGEWNAAGEAQEKNEESNKGILISMNVQLPDGAIGILSWQEELRDGVTFQDARETAGVHFIAATEGLGAAWLDSVTVSVIDL